MTQNEREEFIKKIETNFTEEEKKYYLRNIRHASEPFYIGIDGWIKNNDERLKKHPESKNVILFERYMLFKLYDFAKKLAIETDKLFT